MPAGLINSFSTHITPIVLIFAYNPTIAGFYALTQRALGLPLTLVGQSISQVYLSQAPELLQKDVYLVRELYKKVARNLFLVGVVPIILLGIFGEGIFTLVFGESWANSGVYLQVLFLMFIAQFTVAPLSQTLNILNKQNIQLLWDITRVVVSMVTIIYPSKVLLLKPEITLLIYSVSMSLLYIGLYFISLHYLKSKGDYNNTI
ncbi:oligosaccharide flippase family protein [Halobacillus naozhouensis]|uniref:Oligosaccharide flippase family protein n=2 Tax=Halobacillus naozhouensis TaxID=554880 RepID=A0ABY8IYL7_9BACI|nr:oligosaccharide flippase family protein [Halobacillus naozhouensis]WFT74303.1 oligosaccharide flippase family protein [Halobacillus naozhouensis]